MSPIKQKKLDNLRKKLDILDNSFIKLIKKRTNLVNEVLNLKSYKKQIVDRKRIKIILKNIKKKSIRRGIDPRITKGIWIAMIREFVKYEYRNFRKK